MDHHHTVEDDPRWEKAPPPSFEWTLMWGLFTGFITLVIMFFAFSMTQLDDSIAFLYALFVSCVPPLVVLWVTGYPE